MAIFDVANQVELNAAIATITGRASVDVINFTTNFTLSANLTPLFLVAGENLTINGNDHTMDGANTYGGFVIQNGTVAINDLTIAHTTARGGNGGYMGGNGGGGGAGLGGGLFVGTGAHVTITDVDFTGDRAIGGNGGSWNTYTYGPGGLWNGFLGATGPSFGGGGNGSVSASTRYANIDGGFGGGGGGITNYIGGPYPAPGNGGYGAGEGGHDLADSISGGGGGGGLGAGGAIFVDTLGTLTIGGGTISGGAVQGGAAGNSAPFGGIPAGGGGSAGSGIFLHGATITFTPAAGQTSTVSDTIHEGDGTGGIVMRGAGTLQLGGANLFAGGVAVYSGTLSLGNAASAGSGAVSFLGYGTLQLASGVNIANTIKNFGLSDSISLLGFGAVTSISLDAGTKILTVTNGLGASKTVHFDVTYAYAGNNFVATVDGNGNTVLKIANLLTDSDFKMVDLSDTGPGVTVNHTIGNTTSGALTGWTGTGQFGGFAPTATASTGFAGNNVGYVNVGGSVSQTISGDFDSYHLELDLGSRLDVGDGSSVKVEIFVGSTSIKSQTYDTSATSQGHGTVSHKVLDTITLDAAQKGLPVKVVISNLGGSQLLFDNVVLTGIDTTAPVVTSSLANDAGASNTDMITNVAALTGTGDANAVVHFTVDGNVIAQTATANSAGVWTFTPTGLSNGHHTIVASETDAGGNTGAASLTFTLDTSAPTIAIGTVAGNDRVSAAEGASGFTVSGTTSGVEDGQSVTVSLNGHSYSAQVTSNAWSLTVPGTDAIADGPYVITANVSDVAGNAATQATRAITINETIAASNIVDHHLVEATAATPGTATATAAITLEAGSSYDSTALASAGWTQDPGSPNLWSQVSTYGTATLDTTAETLVFQLDDAAANALRATDHPTPSFLVPLVDTDGNTGSTLVSFTVDGANDAPTATDDSYTTGEDTPLVIDAAAGVLANDSDIESDALSAVVVDGPEHGTLTLNADGSLSYEADANYNGADSFTYRVGDGAAYSNVATVDINVTAVNDVPVATDDSYTTGEDTPLVIDAAAGVLANDSDIESDALSAVVVNGPEHGTLTLNADGSLSYEADANYNGADSFTYRVGDGTADPNVATVDIDVTAVNDAPVATNDSYTTSEGTPLVIDAAAGVLANDSDIESDALSAILVAGPAHGTLTLNANGSLSYTADANYNGADSFTYKASDGAAVSNVATVNINVTAVNDVPVATNNSYTVSEDTLLTINAAAGVLSNDGDIDNDALSAILVSGPAHGTLTLNADGSLSYQAHANYNGADSFTYKAGDGAAVSNVATVDINVTAVNDAPAATNNSYTTSEGTPLVIDAAAGVLANDSDIESDALSAILVAGPAHGTLTLNANGSLSYTADANYNGADSFTYKASDGAAVSNVATVDINVTAVNDVPVATNNSYTASEDTLLTINAAAGVLSNDGDIDNDALSAILVSGPAHGTLTLNADGSLSYTAHANYNGADSFTYKAGDGTAVSNVATVDINVTAVNDAPAATNNSYTTGEGTPLVIDAAAGVLANDSDIESDALSAILVAGPAHGTLTLNANGSLSYTADANYNGADSFTYKASDGAAVSNVATVNINVTAVNDVPVATNNSYTASEDTLLTINAAAGVLSNDGDIDNDALSAILVTGPAHGTLTLNADGSLSYTAVANYNGADSFTYKASDGAAVSNVATVGITVAAVNDAPVATNNSYTTSEDTSLVIGAAAGVLANDSDIENHALSAVVVRGPAHGALTLNANGSLSYTADANYNGADSFTYKARDGAAVSNVATVGITVTAVNDAPRAAADAFSANEATVIGSGLSVFANNGHGADRDIDGPALSVSAVNGVAGNVGALITLASGARLRLNADGTFSYDPHGAFDYLPAAGSGASNLTATDSFTYALAGGDTATVTITLRGLDSAGDLLIGTEANNVLNGGIGADTMRGGAGDDVYVVDSAGDKAIEALNQGTDTVRSRVSLTLAANIENLTLINTAAALNGTGNGLDNTITGNDYANVLNGATGTDRLAGGKGNDLYVTDGHDIIVEASGQGIDTVQSRVSLALAANLENLALIDAATALNGTGNSLGNIITGNDYANVLDGITGIDRMAGGKGNDLYVTDGHDTIVEASGQGIDTVQSRVSLTLAANVENLTLINTATALNGTGNSLGNIIVGNDYANVLDGITGIDRLAGGKGNDLYVTDGHDTIVEASGQGIDTVESRVSLTLVANVENLTLINTATALNGVGNSLNNVINGNDYANVLNGTTGSDRLAGGKGNDIYVTDGHDAIVEASGQGTDTVRSRVSLALAANVENLTLTNTATALNGAGNSLDNIVTGNDYANSLNGGGGSDTLFGGSGDDWLAGGGGNDYFVFDTSPTYANRDTIVDFGNGDDTIQLENSIFEGMGLGNLQSQFFFVGNVAHDRDDRIIYQKSTGALYYDSDGTGSQEKVQFASIGNHSELSYNDFVLI